MVALNEQLAEKPTVIEVKKVDAPTPISDEDFDKAQKSFVQGKKFLVLNKFDEAVSNFDEACETFTKKYGEMNIECADLYFFYGKALLELARVENTVLGNALNGIPDDSAAPINDSRYGNPDEVEEKERETIAEKVIDAMCEPETAEAAAAASVPAAEPEATKNEEIKKDDENMQVEQENVEEKKEEEKPKSEENGEKLAHVESESKEIVDEIKPVEEVKKDEEKKSDEAAAEDDGEDVEEEDDDEEGDEAAEGEGEGEKEEEDISNLQRSWEMFELAKLIYKNNTDQNKITYTKRIAECLLKLGEIGIEQELCEQAIVDISESIKLQEDDLLKENRDERLLAETYYQLGLAQQFNNQFKLANESYQRSINILQIRIDKLNNELTTNSASLDDDNKKQITDEIKELEAVLPEITTKLDECNEQDQQTMNLVKEAKECFINKFNANGSGVASNANGDEVKDITSLVKSKRKISASSSPSKKSKIENEECEQQQNGGNSLSSAPEQQQLEAAVEPQVPEPVPAATEPIKEQQQQQTDVEISEPQE